ncbi:hypothetical protein N657DRAFT_637190 [Parathielavia appendiculata]|uniref:Nephrocystin 3-like N-terminal domain-containing protein n=1 Tax=Parathielavia appendiculata TaxID=2587402 RepID=A0AAN6YZP4_9PEZI|nr:hypothetical protein N657DRAFT_637190 [Parathielavia appendiculata]
MSKESAIETEAPKTDPSPSRTRRRSTATSPSLKQLIQLIPQIVIAVRGRFDGLTNEVTGFLKRIPVTNTKGEALGLFVTKADQLTVFQALIDSRFVLTVALDTLKPTVANISSSFKTHMDVLPGLLQAQSFASIQENKDGQVETLNHNEIQNRADDACRWLTSDDAFTPWLLSRDSNALALFGDMGSGKTMTTAFVADSLAKTERPLCAYYCKDEQKLSKLRNIYRSILFQFVIQGNGPDNRGNPTESDTKLRNILFDIISSSYLPVFVVVDALDECGTRARKQFLSLFHELLQNKAPLKLLVSSRYSDAIEADFPSGFARAEPRLFPARDGAIATYLVEQTDIPRLLRQALVALEIFSVAQRPLNPDEFAQAVFTINPVGEDPPTLTELDESSQSVDISRLVRPFITVIHSKGEKRMRLIHQSLKELVLTASPSEYICVGGVLGDNGADSKSPTGTATPKSARFLDLGPPVLASGQWRQHNGFCLPERDFPELMVRLNPVVIAAVLSPAATVADLLKLNLDTSVRTINSVWTAVQWFIWPVDISALKNLVKIKAFLPAVCDRVLFGCFTRPSSTQSSGTLCSEPTRILDCGKHQSIGEAAYVGRADVVRFLCEQAWLEPHRRHVNGADKTVFRQAVWKPDDDVLRTLIRYWPGGVNGPDKGGYTPLSTLLFNYSRSFQDGAGSSVLCTAVREGSLRC